MTKPKAPVELEPGDLGEDTRPNPSGTASWSGDCKVCAVPLTWAGVGAKPQYCADHKTDKRTSSTRTATSSRSTKDERLRAGLSSQLATVGLVLMMVEPYDGLVVIDRAPATVDALMEIAAQNPKVYKLLEQALTVSAWAAVATALAGLALPIAAHHGILPIPAEAVEAQFLSEDTRRRIATLPPRGPRRARPAPAPAPPPAASSPFGEDPLGPEADEDAAFRLLRNSRAG